ncbi:ceramidase domain-containing protein [Kaarinaea lacus]
MVVWNQLPVLKIYISMPENSLLEFLDHYCERVAPGFWNEPFNLLSNLAFIITGFLVWRMVKQQRQQIAGSIWDLMLLNVLLFAIGIGSSLWHLLANQWSLLADTIPILLFINLFLLSCLFRVFSLTVTLTLGIFIAYHVINYLIQSALPSNFLNGSIFYLPTWGFLLGIAVAAGRKKVAGRHYYIGGWAIFTISLIFRTVDQSLCTILPIGTHFIWHILNAATLFLLMYGLIYNSARNSST